MMGPKFSLQAVLDFRHSRVEFLEMELAKLQETYQQGLDMQTQCQDTLAMLYLQLQQEQNGDLNLFNIEHLRQDSRSTKDRLDQIKQALAILVERIENKRQETVTARQSEEALNILKEKEMNRWKAEQLLVESRQQDNVYIAQAFRRANGRSNV
jgi:flagellar export protein FliJ